jgi:hypothetical protein
LWAYPKVSPKTNFATQLHLFCRELSKSNALALSALLVVATLSGDKKSILRFYLFYLLLSYQTQYQEEAHPPGPIKRSGS